MQIRSDNKYVVLDAQDIIFLQSVSRRWYSVSQDRRAWRRVALARTTPKRRREYELTDEIDWKAEYIARNAEISVHWLKRPSGRSNPSCLDVQSVSTCNEGRSLITAFNGGRIGIWDIGRYAEYEDQDVRRSTLKATSDASTIQTAPGHMEYRVPTYTESMSVDNGSGKAYVASGSSLVDIDLQTLAAAGRSSYTTSVTALSAITSSLPMTVATEEGIHIHDPRLHNSQNIETAPTGHHTPNILSILHRGPHAIHVAGRFPSIITYDRRFLSKVHSTIWSGAHALTSLSELPQSGPYQHGGALLAAGQHKSQYEKGSLEIYNPDPLIPLHNGIATTYQSHRNRAGYCGRKLLYAIPHGCRIVCSDSDGHLTWVERDARPIVRQWDLPPSGEEEAMARKIIRLGNDPEDPRADLAIWTGTAVGIVGFGTRRFDARGEAGDEESQLEEGEYEDKEHAWRELTRRELHRQAEDLRYLNGFGFFSSNM